MYTRNAFSGYNFAQATKSISNPSPSYATTTGGNILLTWFPIKSLSIGRLGFGVVGGIYWSTFNTTTDVFDSTGKSTGTTVTKASPQEATTYGARAVYEFDYWLGQILVPYAFLGVDNVMLKAYSVAVGTSTSSAKSYVDIPATQIISQYYGGGIHFNLNRVEPVAASRGLVNIGVRKFYLSYMALQRSGSLYGLTHNLGLNFEF